MGGVCNPVTPRLVLEKLAEDRVVFIRRGVAQNSSIPAHLLIRLNDDPDIRVRALAFKNTAQSNEVALIVSDRKSVSSELRSPSYRP